MVGMCEVSDILVQGGITNGVAKMKWIKIIRNFKSKIVKIM